MLSQNKRRKYKMEAGAMKILKRDGKMQDYSRKKIEDAIFKAIIAVGGTDRAGAEKVAKVVEEELINLYCQKQANGKLKCKSPTVEEVQDLVETFLIKSGHDQIAKSYILYREKRRGAREDNALTGAVIDMFEQYLEEEDSAVKNTANGSKSVAGLNNFVREEFTKNFWLNEIYPYEVSEAHRSGTFHIHDLGFFGAYCVGWDVKQLLMLGFTGVIGKISSGPAKHFRTALGHIVNATFTLQGESAGAQAWSSFDTYLAPFIKYDNLTYKQVKQCLQEFIFNMNVSTRVGFQCPFSNVTLDIKVPKALQDEYVVIGGEIQDKKYKDFQAEMDMFNTAFCEVMQDGDNKGRVFTFPIPTINITKNFDWNNPVVDKIMEITCKYGIPYFANYINSDLDPDDAVSMCCRLRLDVRELKKRGGGLFGSNPLTGSIGVVTINLPRLGYKCENEEEFFNELGRISNIAKESLEIKRKVVENQTTKGLYPYAKFYLQGVKDRSGGYWANHFNTIGIIGMQECIQNAAFLDNKLGLITQEGQEFALKIMHFLRSKLQEYQAETGHVYNLEATPAEGVTNRLATIDKKRYPKIITGGNANGYYYTNSTHLPVQYTEDVFEMIKMQDELQSLYTGGTVVHLYTGEKLEDGNAVKSLIRKIFTNYKMPYISITPTFSICQNHGYRAGEHWTCPQCGAECEVWSRVVGFLRPVADYNKGKRQEYKERTKYKLQHDERRV
ncbi:MAG: ribonucleoside triphosphate reductase [Christensenellaceae bacterium]|jgi:ribonucleoside-triphosphate reductase|nr:ribonucleoside triphosphate reductase [Christensenellaceae bacterium]